MKIDTSKARKSSLEVPPDCKELIERLCRCTWSEVLIELKKIDTWTYGKCELYHWVRVLDYFDAILESAATREGPAVKGSQSWHLKLDDPENDELKELVIWVLHFTTLLIEHSFSRHMYNSVEHLLVLLSSCNLEVVLAVLNLLYMFSKRSNFILRLKPSMRDALLKCLTYLAESWGGRENGFGLADCCRDNPSYCPPTATTLHYEFYSEEEKSGKFNQVTCIHVEGLDKLNRTAAEIMNSLLDAWKVPIDGQMSLFTHVRLAHAFSNYQLRLQCVQARLQSLSILLYNHSFIEIHNLLYPGLLDELVELLEINDPKIIEIKAAALRTLTSIIHLDRNPRSPLKPGSRLNMIIDVTGASLYHGFLPQMVRNCISSLTGARSNEQVPLPLATALFSFLYHLSSYEQGSEALVNCGMMESLLKIVNWPGKELEHITFVTRAVRVIDLITNMDMQAFQTHGGMNSFIDRLEMEVKICRTEQPFEITPTSVVADAQLDEEMNRINVDSDSSSHSQQGNAASSSTTTESKPTRGRGVSQKTCLTQRAALLKSMLNFMKKALQDTTIQETIRTVMDGSLPSSLKHIISNAEYYGPSLFLLATDVVTAYVFQEPTLLTSLQENGLTDVVLHALLVKDVPATREVLGSLPNVFSALCLNPRGLNSFVRCRPFDKLFKVLISPVYLSAMRNRRSVNNGDTATNLGNAMDELMRHQPSLKSEATAAIIRLLEALCQLGRDPRYVCWRALKGESAMPGAVTGVTLSRVANDVGAAAVGGGAVAAAGAAGGAGGSSDEEDDDEEEAFLNLLPAHKLIFCRTCHIMKFIDAILSNNSTDDHCQEFVNQDGLVHLLSVLGLPNLPVDYPSTVLASQSVASVCKSIMTLGRQPVVMQVALNQLSAILEPLAPLIERRSSLEGSILLHELAQAGNLDEAMMTPSATPLLHAISAVNSYVIMLVNVCRTAQSESRTNALLQWASPLGMTVLDNLCKLYSSSLWESTILLALCSDDPATASRFSRHDVERLFPSEMSIVEDESGTSSAETESEPMDVDEQTPRQPATANEKIRRIPTLCVGTSTRGRRHQTQNPEVTKAAETVAMTVAKLLIRGVSPSELPTTPLPKFALTYLICSLGFSTPLLFDDKKYPYHVMLEQFVQAQGPAALFQVFKWAITAGNTMPMDESVKNLPGLPEGTDEFLDAWFIFMEKMLNPKTSLDKSHIALQMPHIYYVQHLMGMHKMMFMAIMKLWGKRVLPVSNWTYWPRIVETMLTILKLIICGECIMNKPKQALNRNQGQGQDQEIEEATRRRQQVNVSDLQQLMDMGFSRDHCYEALILTSTMEHATDYLLNNFFPYSARSSQQASMETEDEPFFGTAISLDDQTENAIDLSEFKTDAEFDDLIKKFGNEVVPTCLQMLEDIPEYAQHDIVYHICELIKTVLLRIGSDFTTEVLKKLSTTINTKVQHLIDALEVNSEVAINAVFTSPESSHTSSIITLYTLVFEDLKIPCAEFVHSSGMLDRVVQLLCKGSELLTEHKYLVTPRWMTSILQLLDLVEKVSVATKRKSIMHDVTIDKWKWFDLSIGVWQTYERDSQKTINNAYWNGFKMVKFHGTGRRTYSIAFQHMMQTNEESGKTRPVMRTFIDKKDEENIGKKKREVPEFESGACLSFSGPVHLEIYDGCFFEHRASIRPIEGIPEGYVQNILRASVSLLKSTDNKETIQAALVMCVRFTRQFEMARFVAEMDVVKTLLSLRSATNFPGFENLATILIRHILEEPSTLEVAFEKVLRAKTLQNIPPSYKELYFILRECSAAICRDMPTFKNVAERILRIDLSSLPRKSDEEEVRFLMKSISSNQSSTNNKRKKKPAQKSIDDCARRTVYDLLNALVIETDEKTTKASDSDGSAAAIVNQSAERAYANLTQHIVAMAEQNHQRHVLANHLANIVNGFEMPNDHPFPGSSNSDNVDDFVPPLNSSEHKESKVPLLSKSAILKILSDAVRSYNTIASLITQYTYVGNRNTLVKEDCSAIAFVLDNMMMTEEHMPDPERPNLARGLIAAVASCNHSPDAQLALVNEVKSALQRALTMKESAKKHQHVVDLVGIVTIMIENCPPVPINSTPLTTSLKLSQFSTNNMVRFMMKRNIVVDLARISHTLDLSSPKMSSTVNAALKPLETLSRIMSCPPSSPAANASKMKTRAQGAAAAAAAAANAPDQPGTSTSDSTNAQGEDAVEDTDNTDHDMTMSDPVDEESIDVLGRHDGICNAMRNELEELIDGVNNDLGSDSPMIDNDDDDANPANPPEMIIFDDNSFEQLPRRLNNHGGQRDGSSGEDSDSNSTEDRRMDDNDDLGAGADDDAVDGEEDGDEDEEEEDDDQEEEEEDDEEDEDDDDDGDHYDNETFEMFDTEDGVLHIPGLDHESDDFLMIEFSEPIDHSTPLMPWISPAFSFPSSLLDEATHENSNGPLGGRMPPLHPFLMSRQNLGEGSGHHRSQRLSRTRRHENGHAPHPHPHGSVTADIITTTLTNNTRVVVMDNGLGIFTNTEEEQISYVDQSGYLSGPSLAATLNNVPTSTHWWNEEAKLIDGDSQADAAAVVGYDITNVVLQHRAEELAERRETIKKFVEQKRKKKEPEKKDDYSGLMDILETSPGTDTSSVAAANVLAAAAQEVAQATESLAGSIVDSVLNTATRTTSAWPSSSQQPPSTLPLTPLDTEFYASPSSQVVDQQNLPPSSDSSFGELREPSSQNDEDNGGYRSYSPSEEVNDQPLPDTPERDTAAAAAAAAANPDPGTQLTLGDVYPLRRRQRSSQGGNTSQESVDSQATVLLPRNRPIRRCERPPYRPAAAAAAAASASGSGSGTQMREFMRAQRLREMMRSQRQSEISIDWTPTEQEEQQQQPQVAAAAAAPAATASTEPQVPAEEMYSVESTTSQHVELDPLGLIPGSVPFPAQTDPDDGFFRVNRYETEQNEENTETSTQESAAARMSTWLDSQMNSGANAPNPAASSHDSEECIVEERNTTVVPSSSSSSSSSGSSSSSSEHNNAAAESEQPTNNASSSLSDIPEGVDPSFLEALPEDMRAEVIQEHLRLQRMSARSAEAGEASSSGGGGGGASTVANLEVNADFLNALPPAIQQEVLAQQRLEQQRQAAALANPNEPMDPTAFFQDLAPPLRQAILADMEESQISVLPPELAAEAQNLRREWEARNRQLVQERFLNHVTNSSNSLSSILRNSAPRNASRQAGQRYTIQGLPQRGAAGLDQPWNGWTLRQHPPNHHHHHLAPAHKPNARTPCRQILDYDSICCLLILLFIDDTKLNTVRLHRVFRNLCYHAPSRDWIIKALLSIMEKSNEGVDNVEKTASAATSHRSSKRIAARTANANEHTPALLGASALGSTKSENTSWLNISMDAALGCRATVFHVNKIPGRRTGTITINHQAAPFVYRHALDLLISLAKTFPSSFMPTVISSSGGAGGGGDAAPGGSGTAKKHHKDGTTFWEILVRLDASYNSKKGKNTEKNKQINQEIEHTSLDSAPFGQLLKMLASPVVRKSSLLTNKLLRLLSLVSCGLQINKEQEAHQVLSEETLRHLSLVADVLTSVSCTEEGLEDATALLLNMSVKLKPIRDAILRMLLDSATKMAERMNKDVETLLKEVVASCKHDSDDKNDNRTVGKGILSNRFTNDPVVVSAPKKVKTGLDLQLSSMAPLISKTSSQASLLRILKVIVQIRESVRAIEAKTKENDEENDEDETEDEEEDDELFLEARRLEAREEGGNERQDTPKPDKNAKKKNTTPPPPPPLSELLKVDHLWTTLSRCLRALDKTQDSHAVLVLQPAVEAFFIVHASSAEAPAPSPNRASSEQPQPQPTTSGAGASQQLSNELAAPPPLSPLPTDGLEPDSVQQAQSTQSKFLKFAETHRTVLNQILRQSNTQLVDGPFSVLVNHTRVLDFDVKRRYFRSELERADEANRREELAVHVKRNAIFEDSFRELHRRTPDEWKNRFYIVFEGEEGQDAGGLLREWYMIISREIFNPDYALFSTSAADKVTYTINTSSHYNNNHLCYFKFVGRVIAKAIYDNKLLECYFTRSFYKHILGIPVKYTDMESEDYTFYKSLVYLFNHHVSSLGYDITFSTEVQEFGVTSVRDLLPNGRNIFVNEENKLDYIRLVCQMKMTGAIRQQLDAFLEGFYDIIPNRLISIFNEQELELLISGLPNVDIDDLKSNTEYYKYQPNSLQIQWFWRALREFNQAERAKFLQFVTGTSKVPLQGFSALEGMNGVQKFQIHRDERSTDRLPSAHTCFNQLDLPVYETYTKLREYLLKAIHECSEGFGFA
ncbi:hypothetical protein LSTR_LSTR011436 [Laodelphax striatellus]|uniref:HECT-type E3 ubiquitin transferase n=1 Tax=Laodelphax striatellus TaxID=195883 RepID=A0A482WHI5_LAOST|nr:hypothetical protein LSTR_LSTR011436 [Laodelphax striatellus]